MKRIFAILFLCLYTTQSHAIFWAINAVREATMTEEEKRLKAEEEKTKKYYFGINMGIGIMDIGTPVLYPRIWGDFNSGKMFANSMSYTFSLEWGIQKYTSEKIGYRGGVFGQFSFATDFNHPILPTNSQTFKYNKMFLVNMGGKIDGLFDFIQSDETHFGMLLGLRGGGGMIIAKKPEGGNDGFMVGLNADARIGLQVQGSLGALELVLSVPLTEMFFWDENPWHSTLTLGYKYLF